MLHESTVLILFTLTHNVQLGSFPPSQSVLVGRSKEAEQPLTVFPLTILVKHLWFACPTQREAIPFSGSVAHVAFVEESH